MNNNKFIHSNFATLEPSSTLYINETVNRLWQQGKQALHMGFGESRFDVHPRLQEALAIHSDKKSYLAGQGLPKLRETIASYYTSKLGHKFNSAQVAVGPGSKALIYALQMIFDADLFLPSPSWVSYAPQAQLIGRAWHYIPTSVQSNYQLSIEELDRLAKQSNNPCKLLILNSPNNPTGNVFSAELLKEIADYCRANNILVLSDEIYFEVCHGNTTHRSISEFYPEGTFVLGGLSKHMSIGGWRIGVALLPDTPFGAKVMKQLIVVASEIWSSVSAPVQYAAIEAYSMHDDIEEYIAECTDIHGIRTRFLRKEFLNLGIECSDGDGAFYLMPNFDQYKSSLARKGVTTSFELAKYLLESYDLASLPGSDFGLPEDTLSLRLSTSYLDMEQDDDSERILSAYRKLVRQKANKTDLMRKEVHPNCHASIKAFADFLNELS